MAKSLPSDYSEIARWTLGDIPVWFSVVLSGLSLLAFFITLFAALALVSLVTGVDTISLGLGGILLGLLLGLVLHEVTHAAVFLAFRARPTFGFKPWTRCGPVFYVSAPGRYLHRAAYLTAGLAPVVLLTPILLVAAVLLPAGSASTVIVLFAVAFNVAGSVGDLLMAWKVLTYPRETCFQDTADGFTVYGRATT